ncbi:hypothetical protein PC128_g4490 [Phytophthora cactorum]|nr:hypothetical protein PC128_g4490 [Phytophthora cactorum]
MVKLFCAIVGVAGSAFEVDIDKGQKLFLAKMANGAWLPDNDALDTLLQSKIDTSSYLHMRGSWQLSKPELFGPGVSLGKEVVHVLVVAPEQAQPQERLSLVSGSIENALNTKGIRCRVYRLAASYLGYYDPDLRAGESDKALWYDGATLRIHVLCCTERDALLFENELQNEGITQTSPLDGHTVSTSVASISRELSELRRILTRHYVPEDTDSPQRIESEEWFGTVGKAQSCHLMSREHCRRYASYHKYDNDQSNRLALTSDMRDWYDGRSFAVPVMNISVESVSEGPVVGSRYKVNLIVRALNAAYARLISLHLKEGFVASEDGLEMRTSVYVQNRKVFCECMEWKRKEIDKRWKSYYDMVPAVD